MAEVQLAVEVAEKVDGLEILAAAEGVGNPLAGLARVVAVQHRSHPIHPQPVAVVALEPEQGARGQEAAHLVAAVIEDQAAPVRMKTFAGIGVLVQVASIELSQPVGVGREMGWNPVEQHADAGFVEGVDQLHQLLGGPLPVAGREEAGDLVAPGTEKGMLHHRQEFHVREPERAHILHQQRRELEIAQRAMVIAGVASPGAEVNLVDRHRGGEPLRMGSLGQPARVAPVVAQVPDDRGRVGRNLAEEPDRVGLLEYPVAVARANPVLVAMSDVGPGDIPRPDPEPADLVEARSLAGPAVEVADDRDLAGVGRPDREARSAVVGMRPEAFVDAGVGPGVEALELAGHSWVPISCAAASVDAENRE